MGFDISIYNADCGNPVSVMNSIKAAYLYGDRVTVFDQIRPRNGDVNEAFQLSMDNLITRQSDFVTSHLLQDIGLKSKLEENTTELIQKKVRRTPSGVAPSAEIYDLLNNNGEVMDEIRRLMSSKRLSAEIQLLTGSEEDREREAFIFNEVQKYYDQLDLGKISRDSLAERLKDYGVNEEYLIVLLKKRLAEYDELVKSYKSCFDIQKYNYSALEIGACKYMCEAIDYLRRAADENYSEEKYLSDLNRLGINLIAPEIIKDGSRSICSVGERFIDDSGFKVYNGPYPFSSQNDLRPTMWVPSYLSEYSISALPGFEQASLDEIVDIRKELNRYIVPYRAAMIRMAEKIKNIPDIESLHRECMTLYLSEIEPQVASINMAIADNNVFKNIAKTVLTDQKTWAAVGSLVAAFTTQGDMANALSISAAITFGGLSISQSIRSTLEENKKIGNNEMFFLYQAGQMLNKR